MNFILELVNVLTHNKRSNIGEHMRFILVLFVALLAAGGWVANIIKLISDNTPLAEWTILEILRVLGLVVVPLGVVMGYI